MEEKREKQMEYLVNKSDKKRIKEQEKEIRKLAKKQDIKTYVSKYGNSKESIEEFIHYVYTNLLYFKFIQFNIDFSKEARNVFSLISNETAVDFLMYGNFDASFSSDVFISKDYNFREKYVVSLIDNNIDFKDALNLEARSYFKLNYDVVNLAIQNDNLLNLLESFDLDNSDTKTVEYVKEYGLIKYKGMDLIRFLNSVDFDLKNDEVIKISKKAIYDNKPNMISSGLIYDFFNAISKFVIFKNYDLSIIRDIIIPTKDEKLIGAYIIYYGDLNVSKDDFMMACKYSWKADKNIIEKFFELSPLVFNKDYLRLYYEYGCFENQDYDEEIDNEYNSFMTIEFGDIKIILEVVNNMINTLNNIVLDSCYKKRIKKLSYGKLNDIKTYLNRIKYFIDILINVNLLSNKENEMFDNVISNFVDLSINMMKNKYFDSFLDPIDILKNYEINNKSVNDRIIDYLLGDSNEVDLNRIYNYKDSICDIKYLDDKNILKIAPYYITDDNYYYKKFIKMVDRISNASILYDVVDKTNNIDIIYDYMLICKDKKSVREKYFRDKDHSFEKKPKK